MTKEEEITQDMLTELAKEIWEEAEVEQWIKDFHKGIVDNFLNPPTKSYQELKEYFKEEKGD